jgi:phospholipase/carboxylesterase
MIGFMARRLKALKIGRPSSFVHHFEKGLDTDARPVLLLHGSGQDESALLPLGRAVATNSPLLSPRGKILENGAARFFQRFAEGVPDEDDVRRRAEELADFVMKASKYYSVPNPIALGYSNGANMAVAIMLLRPEILAGAILLRAAMVPISQAPPVDLMGKPILLISGAYDPTIVAERFSQLCSLLQHSGGNVELRTLPAGHGLSEADATLASTWYRAQLT